MSKTRKILDTYREQCGRKTGVMFVSEKGTPLNLNNVLNRMILPVLNICVSCRRPKGEHDHADHAFERDPARPMWHGPHAFRRGLATNLHAWM